MTDTTEISALSLRASIAALEVDESHAIARRLDQDSATSEMISDVMAKLENKARPAISRASKDTGHIYVGEYGQFRASRGHHPILVYVITRTA